MTITVRVRPKAAATTGAGSFTSAIESVSIPASMAAPANPWSANTRSGGPSSPPAASMRSIGSEECVWIEEPRSVRMATPCR